MLRLKLKRYDINDKSQKEFNSIMGKLSKNKITLDEASHTLNIPSGELQDIMDSKTEPTPISSEPLLTYSEPKAIKSIRGEGEYKKDVQKMASFKGVIRPLTLSLKNKNGGIYKMRIINIYVKPNAPKEKKGVIVRDAEGNPIMKEYTRYYEKKSYGVDKQAIAGGSESDYYYPEKARWSKRKIKISEELKPSEPEITRKKARKNALRIKLKKGIKSRCKCIKK